MNQLVFTAVELFLNYRIRFYDCQFITCDKASVKPCAKAINKSLKTTINIKKTFTVAWSEGDFLSLDIKAEIFRRSGNVLVETFLTGNRVLGQQNPEGEDITRHYIAG